MFLFDINTIVIPIHKSWLSTKKYINWEYYLTVKYISKNKIKFTVQYFMICWDPLNTITSHIHINLEISSLILIPSFPLNTVNIMKEKKKKERKEMRDGSNPIKLLELTKMELI